MNFIETFPFFWSFFSKLLIYYFCLKIGVFWKEQRECSIALFCLHFHFFLNSSMNCFLLTISPLSASYSLWTNCITVVLPDPEGPTKATCLPLGIFKLSPCNTLNFGLEGYRKWTSLNSTCVSLSPSGFHVLSPSSLRLSILGSTFQRLKMDLAAFWAFTISGSVAVRCPTPVAAIRMAKMTLKLRKKTISEIAPCCMPKI